MTRKEFNDYVFSEFKEVTSIKWSDEVGLLTINVNDMFPISSFFLFLHQKGIEDGGWVLYREEGGLKIVNGCLFQFFKREDGLITRGDWERAKNGGNF